MNPSWWIPIGILTVLCYLFYMLTIEFKLARLDDAVAPADVDVHNDLNIWSYEFYFPRVKARKLRAFLRWVGVSAAIMLICFLLSGGGSKVVKALSLPTPTPSITTTSTITPTPLASATPSVTNTPQMSSTPHLVTITGTRTQRVYTPPTNSSTGGGSAGQVVVVTRLVSSQVQVTRLVQVTRVVQVAVTRLVTVNPSQAATLTPAPTQTPWIIYVMVTETPTEQASETPSETPTETPTLTETVTEVPSETPTETSTP